jgi:hypothetical protein
MIMKFKLFMFALLMAMVATPAFAQYGSEPSAAPAQDASEGSEIQQPLESNPATLDSSQSNPAAWDSDATGGAVNPAATTTGSLEPSAANPAMGNQVEATVSSIDQEKGELKVNDLSGAERTYQVSDMNSLQDIQAGYQVKITPDPSDPTKAQMVEKNEAEINKGFAL